MKENEKINLFDYVKDKVECLCENYEKYDDEDIYNIVFNILNNEEIDDLIYQEIMDYANEKE